jgi:teichuronic acid biosynthesis glycosyltransferase TuaC
MNALMPGERLRVVFVTGIFPNPEQPELGMFNQQVAREMRRFCDLTVIAPAPWFPSWLPLAPPHWRAIGRIPPRHRVDEATVLSPKFVVLPDVSEPFLAMSLALGMRRTFREVCKEVRPHAVLALYLYPDGVAATWLANRVGVPVVLVGLGTDINRFLGERSKRGQILSAVRRSAGVIVVSDSLKQRLVREGVDERSVTVVPNGVDVTRFAPISRDVACRTLGLPETRRRVLFVGRFAREKGPAHAVNAFGRIAARHPDVDLVMVGDGELRSECEQLAERLVPPGRVVFAGFQPHDFVPTWLAASDTLCLSSLSEGCPNAVLEALACGKPVAGTRVGAVPELVTPAAGALAPPADDAALAAVLDEVLERTWDADTVRAAAKAPSWTDSARCYCEVLRLAANRVLGG